MKRLKLVALVLPYLAGVVAANLIVNHYGAEATPYVAFGLVGMVLIFRDRFADLVGPQRVLAQAALIGAGALLTYLLNQNAGMVVVASVTAFTASECLEGFSYYFMRRRPWLERANVTAALGAVVDSALFLTIAFGFSFTIFFAQLTAKIAGALVWSLVIRKLRRQPDFQPIPAWDGVTEPF